MSFVKTLILGGTLLASALAQGVSFTEWPTTLTAGQPATLRWTGGNGAPVTINLQKGASNDLQHVQSLTSDATAGEFTWIPPPDLPNADNYAFQITQGDQINYSSLIPLSGGTDSSKASVQQKAASTGITSSATETSGSSTITATTASATAASETSRTQTEPTSSMTSTTTSTTTSASKSELPSLAESSSSSAAHPSTSTPFSGSKPSLSTSSFHAVQTGAADHFAAPLGLGAGSLLLALLFQ